MIKILIVVIVFIIVILFIIWDNWDNWFKEFLLVCVKIFGVKIRLVWIGLLRLIDCVIFC